jgi:peptide/nickel transport system permease protein
MSAPVTTLIPTRSIQPGFWHRWLRKPLGVASAVFLLVVIIACALAPLISPYSPYQQDLADVLSLPSATHWLGTDALGRDVLSRLLFGGPVTLFGVLQAVAVLIVISVPVGLIAGYFGGWTDRTINGITDIVLALPTIIIVLAVLAVFGTNMSAAMITLGILGSAGVIRVVRSAVLSVRNELYVSAAYVSGATSWRILLRHVLPRVAGPIIVQAALFAAIALAVQTGLAFLSLGIVPPEPSWGGMVGEAAVVIEQFPWLLVPSGGLIALTILAFGLIGDSVRDAAVEGWSRRAGTTMNWIQAASRGRASSAPTVADTAVLRVEDLDVSFGDTKVLDGVSLELQRGEVLGVVGESGSGKTVTALALLGLLPPGARAASGTIRLQGEDITGYGERQFAGIRGSKIAMVFQEPMVALDPSFRVGDQIAEVVRRHARVSRAESRRRAIALLQKVRLPEPAEVARRYPHEISGGMAQRICIALSLAGDPDVLVADEPTTALDVTVQAEILDLLRSLQSELGMSVILVSHDWGVIAEICDRAVVMYAGQVVESGPVGDLISNPAHPYTSALLESDPARSIGLPELPTIPGSVPAPRDWPHGCHFQPRCPRATAECALPIPLFRAEDDRSFRCIHPVGGRTPQEIVR